MWSSVLFLCPVELNSCTPAMHVILLNTLSNECFLVYDKRSVFQILIGGFLKGHFYNPSPGIIELSKMLLKFPCFITRSTLNQFKEVLGGLH